jgi:hypothetical protein
MWGVFWRRRRRTNQKRKTRRATTTMPTPTPTPTAMGRVLFLSLLLEEDEVVDSLVGVGVAVRDAVTVAGLKKPDSTG